MIDCDKDLIDQGIKRTGLIIFIENIRIKNSYRFIMDESFD